MGLGKTLQSISLLTYVKEFRKVRGPHLVLVPKSTIGNWAREFARFVPTFKVLKLQGADKEERQHLIRDEMLSGCVRGACTPYLHWEACMPTLHCEACVVRRVLRGEACSNVPDHPALLAPLLTALSLRTRPHATLPPPNLLSHRPLARAPAASTRWW